MKDGVFTVTDVATVMATLDTNLSYEVEDEGGGDVVMVEGSGFRVDRGGLWKEEVDLWDKGGGLGLRDMRRRS